MEISNKRKDTIDGVLETLINAMENNEGYLLLTNHKVQTSCKSITTSFLEDLSDLFLKHKIRLSDGKVNH